MKCKLLECGKEFTGRKRDFCDSFCQVRNQRVGYNAKRRERFAALMAMGMTAKEAMQSLSGVRFEKTMAERRGEP